MRNSFARASLVPTRHPLAELVSYKFLFPVLSENANNVFFGDDSPVIKKVILYLFHLFILFFGSGGTIVAVTPINYIFFCQLSSGKPQIIITFYSRK